MLNRFGGVAIIPHLWKHIGFETNEMFRLLLDDLSISLEKATEGIFMFSQKFI